MATTTQYNDSPRHPGGLRPTRRLRIGVIVTMSLASGLVAALILFLAPFIKAQENVLTGVVLLGFAIGWALLGGCLRRLTRGTRARPASGPQMSDECPP